MSLTTRLDDLARAAQDKGLDALESSQVVALAPVRLASATTRNVVARVPVLRNAADVTVPDAVKGAWDRSFDLSERLVATQRSFVDQTFEALSAR